MSPRSCIGTSGFTYKHWAGGVFYPEGLPQREWLEFYSSKFDTVELNVTFYRLPTVSAFDSWHRRTPKNFVFVLKGSRLITHLHALQNCEEPLVTFYERASRLGDKLKVILWQLPPNLKIHLERLEKFVNLLQKKCHGPLHAFEFREASWLCPEVFDLIRQAGMTVCCADWPFSEEDLPDDFPYIYVRRHGTTALYRGNYSDAQLRTDARHIRKWLKAGRDVFVYFNNDIGGYAAQNALTLKKLVVWKSGAAGAKVK
jgi:uncharacterized protein YecE (DUF72 family)